MQHLLQMLLLVLVLCAPAAAQTEVLYAIDRPAGTPSSWGSSLFELHDLDGDGLPELAVGTRQHGGGLAATVHSGADGSLLFELVTPDLPMFVGHAVASVMPPGGTGPHELVVLGAKSGAWNSPNGWMGVFSGEDGRLLASSMAPPSVLFLEVPITPIGDVDGDGGDEFLSLVRIDSDGNGSLDEQQVQLFSSLAAQPLYSPGALAGGLTPTSRLTAVSDHDGDGIDDFAVMVLDNQGSVFAQALEIRSGASGETLASLTPPDLADFTLDGEPLIRTQDADGDGLADLVLGGSFSGTVKQLSSADGAVLSEWSCAGSRLPCFGVRLIEPGDLDFDGHADLIALETVLGSGQDVRIFGLDPISGAILFEELVPALASGYSVSDRMRALPGLDPMGFATFALVEDATQRVTVRRYAPEIGTKSCASTPNQSSQAATIRAVGSASHAADQLVLELADAAPMQMAVFVYGTQALQQPFGSGYLCVGGAPFGRLPAQVTDAAGTLAQHADLEAHGLVPGVSWTFQAHFRETTAVGFQSSDAVTVELLR